MSIDYSNIPEEDREFVEQADQLAKETGLTREIQEEVREFRRRNPDVQFSGLMLAAHAYHEDGNGTVAEGLRESCRYYDQIMLGSTPTIN